MLGDAPLHTPSMQINVRTLFEVLVNVELTERDEEGVGVVLISAHAYYVNMPIMSLLKNKMKHSTC